MQINHYRLGIILLLLLIPLGCSNITKNVLPPQCEGPPCFFVSETNPWPDLTEKTATVLPIHIGMFSLQIPPNVQYLGTLPNAPLVVQYEGYRLGIYLVTEKAFGIEGVDQPFKKSRYQLIDYPALLFTKTPNDPEPQEYIDKLIVRSALQEKGLRFEGAEEGIIFRKGKMTAYMARTNFAGFTGELILTHQDVPDAYIRVIDQHASPETIKKIIASFNLKN